MMRSVGMGYVLWEKFRETRRIRSDALSLSASVASPAALVFAAQAGGAASAGGASADFLDAGVAAFGFYRGWFQVGSDSASDKANVTLSVDKSKIEADK